MTAKPYHHGDLRHALIQGARDHLRHAPAEALSLRQLAREIGVSPNAPYRHFADREALLSAVALEGFRTLVEALRAVAGDRPTVAGLARSYHAFARREPGVFRLMFAPPETAARREVERELFAEILAAVEAEGTGDPDTALRLAAGVWITLQGAAVMTVDGTLDWLDRWLRPGAATLTSAVLDGLAPEEG